VHHSETASTACSQHTPGAAAAAAAAAYGVKHQHQQRQQHCQRFSDICNSLSSSQRLLQQEQGIKNSGLRIMHAEVNQR
jgi:hypothetical protein